MGKRDTFFCIGVRHHKTSLHPLMARFLYSYNTARCHSKLWWRPLASVVKWYWSLIWAGVDNLIALNALTQPNDFAVILAPSGNSFFFSSCCNYNLQRDNRRFPLHWGLMLRVSLGILLTKQYPHCLKNIIKVICGVGRFSNNKKCQGIEI